MPVAVDEQDRGLVPGMDWLLAAALFVLVFLAYQPVWRGGFVFDDDLHLVNNPVLLPNGLARAWVPGGNIAYWPLTFSVYRLEYKLWGLNPAGFHLVNIGLHALSALLLWRVLRELEVPGALVAAAIFALHPVNVESVAWTAQLKNILSLFFGLLSALFYFQFDRDGSVWRYAAAVAAFALSTLAKGMMLTLPIVLLACVWWRHGSIRWRDLLRVLPFVLIGGLMTGIEIWSQQRGQGTDAVRADTLWSRAAVAGCAVWFYLSKVLWPFDLCFFYPQWNLENVGPLWYLPGVVLLVLLGLGAYYRRTWGKLLLLFLVCYVALLLPVLGFVNIYYMRFSLVADHWQYAAMIVPVAVLTGVAVRRLERFNRLLVLVPSLLLLAMLALLTWQQCRKYADAEQLYRKTLESNPECWVAENNLATVLAERGNQYEAIAHLRQALKLNPDYYEAHNNLGLCLAALQQGDEAIAHYRKALVLSPNYAEAHNNLGTALAGQNNLDEAIFHFRKALELKENHVRARFNLALALSSRGDTEEALEQFRQALALVDPAKNAAMADLIRDQMSMVRK